MGDPRSEIQLSIVSKGESGAPVKLDPVVDHFPAAQVATNGVDKSSCCHPVDVHSVEASNLPQKLDVLSRSLNICREIPCMGIIFALMAALFFGIAALVVKLVPNVNPLVVVTFQ